MVDIAWLTATLTVTWLIMKPFGRVVASAGSLLFGLIYLHYGPHMSLQRDVIAILPIATAILLATRRRLDHSINLVHFLVGVLFALAALIKPHIAIGLPAVILYNCIHDTNCSKSVKTLIQPCIAGGSFALVGFLLTLAIPLLWLWRIGALESFWDVFSSYVPLYSQMSGDFQFWGTFYRVIYALRLYLEFGGFDILLMTSMFGVYFVLTKSMSAATKKRAILLFSLVVLYGMYAAIGGKLWTYHWMPYVYFASLGTAMVLFSPPSFEGLRRPIIFPLLVFIVAVTITGHPSRIAFEQLFYGKQPEPPMDGRVDKIATYLNEHLSPTDKVQPLDWISGATHAMLISKAVVATPYITDFQFYHHVSNPYIKNLRKDFIRRLKQEMPTIIIDVHIDNSIKRRMSGLDTTYQFPELKEFIKQHYKKDYTGDDFDIFRIRGRRI